jgi:hypothetical protein
MVFNATFNNNSVIWWRQVLLVEETSVPGENTLISRIRALWEHVQQSRRKFEEAPDRGNVSFEVQL